MAHACNERAHNNDTLCRIFADSGILAKLDGLVENTTQKGSSMHVSTPPSLFKSLAFMGALLTVSACAHNKISGTEIDDTSTNREIFEVIGSMRKALEERDHEALLRLVSKDYVEDMGTPKNSDDYGYKRLKEEVLPQSMKATGKYQVTFEIHEIVVDGPHARVDVRYVARARLDLPSGEAWDTQRDFNRIELQRDNESQRWLIVSGL